MGRRTLPDDLADDILRANALELSSFKLRAALPKKKTGRRGRSVPKSRIEEVRRQAEEMRLKDDYSRATAQHLVMLWAWCHEATYGVAPAMSGKDWQLASFAAGRLVQLEFDGKPERAVALLRWTWKKEAERLKWLKENGRTVNPVGWRLQFSAQQVVRWRANGGAKP